MYKSQVLKRRGDQFLSILQLTSLSILNSLTFSNMKSIRHHSVSGPPIRMTRAEEAVPEKPSNLFAWGRHGKASNWDATYAASVMLFCPLLVIVAFVAIHHFDGSMSQVLFSLTDSRNSGPGILTWISEHFPQPSRQGFAIYGCWLAFQAFLYIVLPGKQARGQITPAGHLLEYKVNGMLAWVVSVALYILGATVGLYRLSAVARVWGPLLVAANVYGYILTAFAYAKAYLFPTHARDNKYSGKSETRLIPVV